MANEKDPKDEKTIDGEDERKGAEGPQGGPVPGSEPEPPKSLTQDEVNEIVEGRIARERKKWEAELERKRSEATEAERLKNMTELEKAQYEARKLKERNDELEEARNLAEQTKVARKSLADAGIECGDDLLACMVGADADKTKLAIDEFKAIWPKALDEAVKRELSRKAPNLPDPSNGGESAGARAAMRVNEKYKTE